MSVGDRVAALYAEAERLFHLGEQEYAHALSRFQLVVTRAQPPEATATDEAYTEAYEGDPGEVASAPGIVRNGKPVHWVADYFTAALFRSGYLLATLGRAEEAKKHLEQAALLWPTNVDVARELVYVYERLGELSNALATLQEAIERHPDNAGLHKDLAWLYNEIGRPVDAVNEARQALALDPHLVPAYEELHAAHERLGQHAEAEAVRMELARRMLNQP